MASGNDTENQQYHLGTLEKGLRILDYLERTRQPLRISEIVAASQMQRGAVFRILATLESAGYIERLDDKRYRAISRRRKIRIGYSGPLTGTAFRRDVTLGLQKAAADSGFELIMLDCNEEVPEEHIANAQTFIDAKVELAVVFLTQDLFAHVLADKFISARVPVIAIETPIPGAIFFGGNNFRAGFMAGQALGSFARDNWNGKFDRLVLVESSLSAPSTQARLSGAVAGLRDIMPEISDSRIVHLDGLAHRNTSRAAIEKLLHSTPTQHRLLISTLNDPSAVGALQAIRATGREKWTVVVGQNATAESRAEIFRGNSPLIASVAYFPEKYGERVIALAHSIINREQTPLAVYTPHVLLDSSNIGRYYKCDQLEDEQTAT